MSKTFDIILWGATGFTGSLAAKYLAVNYPSLRVALAGRNAAKIADILKHLQRKHGDINMEVLVGDLADHLSLVQMTSKGKVVLSTAGPFAKLGKNIIEACIETGTHYVDITGEVQWVREMIDKYHERAKSKKVKIMSCCGFDSIPADIGCFGMVHQMKKENLHPLHVHSVVYRVRGGASGGTIASVMNLIETCSLSELLRLLNPFYLAPYAESNSVVMPTDALSTTKCMDKFLWEYDSLLGKWTHPHVMQMVDTRIVHRSNALQNYSYGRNFIFTEAMVAPNMLFAVLISVLIPLATICLYIPFIRYVARFFMPSPGQGPNEDLLHNGYFELRMWARGRTAEGDERILHGSVLAVSGDPGYIQTAKMASESAICLVMHEAELPQVFGCITPSVGMGSHILTRLNDAGIVFSFNDNK